VDRTKHRTKQDARTSSVQADKAATENYLGELLFGAQLSQTTKHFLGSLVVCKNV